MDYKAIIIRALLLFLSFVYATAFKSSNISCPDAERAALLKFVGDFNKTAANFSSWEGKDCCKWEGVECDDRTGHVVHLDLQWRGIVGSKFNPALLRLKQLSYLDLSGNDFACITIPPWIGSFEKLNYLSLSLSNFCGVVPTQLGNLSRLQTLNLSGNNLTLSNANLNNLCNLRTLELSHSTINSQLDTFGESFSGCLKNSLQELDLSSTSLSGNIPDWIGDLNNLNILYLSFNSLSGSIPASLGKLSKIQELRFDHNKLNGTVSESLGKLNELTYLDLSSNSLVGVMSEHHFSNLTRLDYVHLSFNSLDVNVSYDWVPPFQLTYLDITGCKLGPKFPSWLQTQKSLHFLDLSSAGISDSVPNWFWNSMTNLSAVYLANNELRGVIPNLIKFSDYPYLSIDLSSNFFDGPVPGFPSNTVRLDLSNNSFSGPIPYSIFELMPNLRVLLLSMNKINGGIPMSICNSKLISILISNNHLSGELPNCQNHTTYLEDLDLSNNNLSGGIPKWLCDLPLFRFLLLRNNNLSGELSPFLKACTSLNILDLGGNMFTGRIPTWLGELSSLGILSLTSNNFEGEIPIELSNLTLLQILDLSNNHLLGPIPMSFGDFASMRTFMMTPTLQVQIMTPDSYYDVSMILDTKGREDRYGGIRLSDLKILNLSRNSLSGHIPGELTNLLGLMILDLSSNDLTGQIPFKIGDMTQLEWLDLSRNKLLGAIPSSLSNLNFLEFLNLSYNNFSGRIPTGKQMDTFIDPNRYVGNQYLCGFQINVSCTGIGPPSPALIVNGHADENRKEILLICLITLAGFAVGFWAIIEVLFVNKRFRVWWFLFVDNFARLQKKMTKTNTIDG